MNLKSVIKAGLSWAARLPDKSVPDIFIPNISINENVYDSTLYFKPTGTSKQDRYLPSAFIFESIILRTGNRNFPHIKRTGKLQIFRIVDSIPAKGFVIRTLPVFMKA